MTTMFSGSRLVVPKSSTEKAEAQKISRIAPVLTAEQLLKNQQHKKLLLQCEQLLELSTEQRDIYFTPLIHSFVEFVQNIPETRNSFYAKPHGFISHALVRTASALSMCRAYFAADAKDKNKVQLTTQEMLWMYALFSAGIFNGIGKIFSDFTIDLYNEAGKLMDRWNPFEGSMLKLRAHSFDYDFEEARHIDLFSRRLSVLLAKQLMPPKGFGWLSTDKEVLSFWLALLEDNQRDAGTLGPFMVRADALAINSYFDEKRLQHQYSDLDVDAKAEIDQLDAEKDRDEKEKNQDQKEKSLAEKEKIQLRFSAAFSPPLDSIGIPHPSAEKDNPTKHTLTTKAGIEFLKWLNNQLKSQRFEFNRSIFYLPSGAIFLPTALFEEFRRKNPYYRSNLDVIEAFNKLELQKKGTEKNDLYTFVHTQEGSQKKIQGIILNNAQLILPENINIAMPDGETKTVSTEDLSLLAPLFEPLQPVATASTLAPGEQNHHHSTLFKGIT